MASCWKMQWWLVCHSYAHRRSLWYMAITSAQHASSLPGQHWPSHTHPSAPSTTAATLPGDSVGKGLSLAFIPEAHGFNVFWFSDTFGQVTHIIILWFKKGASRKEALAGEQAALALCTTCTAAAVSQRTTRTTRTSLERMCCRLRDGAWSHAAFAASSGCKSALMERDAQPEGREQGTAQPVPAPSLSHTGPGCDKGREGAEMLSCPNLGEPE